MFVIEVAVLRYDLKSESRLCVGHPFLSTCLRDMNVPEIPSIKVLRRWFFHGLLPVLAAPLASL